MPALSETDQARACLPRLRSGRQFSLTRDHHEGRQRWQSFCNLKALDRATRSQGSNDHAEKFSSLYRISIRTILSSREARDSIASDVAVSTLYASYAKETTIGQFGHDAKACEFPETFTGRGSIRVGGGRYLLSGELAMKQTEDGPEFAAPGVALDSADSTTTANGSGVPLLRRSRPRDAETSMFRRNALDRGPTSSPGSEELV